MRLKCEHGFYSFYETAVGQVSNFMSLTGFVLLPKDNFYTFETLVDCPDFIIKGTSLLGFTALNTFEGRPGEIFEANECAYDFTDDTVKLISLIKRQINLSQASNKFVSNGLILAGSIIQTGEKIKSFDAWYSYARNRWVYSEVTFV